jgi:hypothetical protein
MLHRRGSNVRRRILAVVATAGLVAGTSLAAGAGASSAAPTAAHAFKMTGFTIDTANPKLTSSTHKRLRFFIFIFNNSNTVNFTRTRNAARAASAKTGDALSVGLSAGKESHDWGFGVKRSTVHFNAKKGTGRINTKHQLKRYGKIRLTIAPTGKAHRSCASSTGYTTTRKITLTGKPTFNSKSGKHGWGTVGAHTVTIKGTLTVNFGTPKLDCGGGVTPSPCPSVGINVDDFTQSTSMNTSGRPGHDARVFAFREVSLTSPRGGSRSDFLTGKVKPLTATPDSGGNVAIRLTGASKNIHGSATITSTEPASSDICKQVVTQDYFDATWKNGAKPLSFRGQIEPRFSLPNNTSASAEVTKKAQPG